MASLHRATFLGFACLALVPTLSFGAEAVKVEFYWLEWQPIEGVTEQRGIPIDESGGVAYMRKQPILTNDDIESASLEKTDAKASGFPDPLITIRFRLKKDALRKLAATQQMDGLLITLIDGRRWGSPYYLKSRDKDTFTPFAGLLNDEALAERVVATFKRPANSKPHGQE